MADDNTLTTSTPPTPSTVPPKDSMAQTIVALAIVAGLVIISLAALAVAKWSPGQAGAALTVVGTTIGALATALNAPNGLSSMISAAKKPEPAQ